MSWMTGIHFVLIALLLALLFLVVVGPAPQSLEDTEAYQQCKGHVVELKKQLTTQHDKVTELQEALGSTTNRLHECSVDIGLWRDANQELSVRLLEVQSEPLED